MSVRQTVSRVRTGPHSHTLAWRVAAPKTEAGVRTLSMPRVMIDPMRSWLAALPMAGRDGLVFPAESGRRTPMQSSVLHGTAADADRDATRENGLEL